MASERLSVFEDTDLDLTDFTPQPKSKKPKPPMAKLKAVTEAAQFPSREAPEPVLDEPLHRKPRYHKTGRTAQLNCRVTPAWFDKVYAIADQRGWLVGETVERAIEALERELDKGAGEGAHRS